MVNLLKSEKLRVHNVRSKCAAACPPATARNCRARQRPVLPLLYQKSQTRVQKARLRVLKRPQETVFKTSLWRQRKLQPKRQHSDSNKTTGREKGVVCVCVCVCVCGIPFLQTCTLHTTIMSGPLCYLSAM